MEILYLRGQSSVTLSPTRIDLSSTTLSTMYKLTPISTEFGAFWQHDALFDGIQMYLSKSIMYCKHIKRIINKANNVCVTTVYQLLVNVEIFYMCVLAAPEKKLKHALCLKIKAFLRVFKNWSK